MGWIYEDELPCGITPIMFEFSRVIDGVRMYPSCDKCDQVLKHDDDSGPGVCRSCNRPAYKHDCDGCTFLGTIEVKGQPCDLYHCDQGRRPTVIARYSSDGPDYNSGLAVAGKIPELTEARGRAAARGLNVQYAEASS